ncbi:MULTISPECIES: amidophosphoribosyltransferase [Agrobacterium]|jgi:amidophosphoribosyltransferase|uniref:Amidophosphoribosyltransferase n=1 Tax=Agrobacterium rubi TaxID=28099 RepID=A0AAE7UNP1_9HYPH|nr:MULTISPECIES: amidophosphoribosyltransferase [Agrobacterium]NTE85932.1 amidophosphoribosyltransferase [Agrobacterium rubi]NTF01863.1 amidophosphoribosyltransferase [Agrobacterium rubi]NTF36107.1 amidophosphoribosyltransferase [Agrobacterium rubi]OCJ54711.1 amidophosphoribosyltransferase [Agrobacterium rubi]QTG01193.1 amidophosphoribosyltransferase [Agrobacterium rubi]
MNEPLSQSTFNDIIDGDTLHEECGVFGVLGHPDAAALTALGLHALQHRGQEAAGMVSFDGKRFYQERHMGLVGDHYTNPVTLARLPGSICIGHTRYSTTGEVALRNVQPLFAELEEGGIAVAHNGNFTNGLTLRRQIIATGAICQSTSDTEVVLHLIARSRHSSTADRFIDAIRQMEGGYSMLAMTRTKLIAARDPTGIRPLVMGDLDGKPIFCSETCALDIIGAKFVRDVENGEVIICEIQPDGSVTIDARKPVKPQPERLCLFEYVYFARPDSVVGGRNVYTTRKNMGAILAKEAPLEADVVVPVPDGGTPAALGFAQESGIPFEYGIIRNHYVGRTFIEPTQSIRALGVKLKHSANRAMIEGKRVVLVDDSIVRGTTSVKIVQMIREAGAKEVHIRVASPMIFHPDFYGIDTPDADKLLANQYANVEDMAKFIGVDSLAFLSINGLYQAVGGVDRNDARPQFTDHYFTGEYPTRLLDKNGESMGNKISMLASNG